MIKKLLKLLGVVLGVVILAVVGSVFFFKSKASGMLATKYDVPVEPIPMPFPLDADERAAFIARLAKKAGATPPAPSEGAAPAADASAQPAADAPVPPADAPAPAPGAPAPVADAPAQPAVDAPAVHVDGAEFQAEALRRAVARGDNYLKSRAGCRDCHGADFGGKVIIDKFPMGRWIAPNISRGGVTRDYRSEDWVRLVRHGVKPSGLPAVMPCQDFTWLSDQEISDIAVYIKSQPAVERVMPASEFGPVFSMLLATGKFPLAAATVDHTARRDRTPPALEPTIELGQHLATTCVGCHGPKLAGGPIIGGDPSWPPAANLTFDASGLEGYTLHDFHTVLTTGKTKDGRTVSSVMPVASTKNLSAIEREALFKYLSAQPPLPKGTR
jgi:mono/diheme cytochrome c family protein